MRGWLVYLGRRDEFPRTESALARYACCEKKPVFAHISSFVQLSPLLPDRLPSCKFARSDLVAGKISFVQVQKFGLSHFPEAFALVCSNLLFGPESNVGGCCPSIHSTAHSFGDGLSQS